MLQFFIICALLFNKDALTQECEAEDKYPWSFHGPNNNPKYWKNDYPDCGKKDQSPIEIGPEDIKNQKLQRLNYTGFNNPITKATVQNEGWTVMVIPEDGASRYIQWGKHTYYLDEVHFHFGTTSNPGAEHVLDGIRHEMEIHYVTHVDENPNNLSIFASLMHATDQHNYAFDPITEVLPKVQYRNDSTELKSQLDLAGLLPPDSRSFYKYTGSDAIPPCEPDFVWWILKDIGKVGNDQLDEFMTLYAVGQDDASDSCRMSPNYRPTQDLDGRFVASSE